MSTAVRQHNHFVVGSQGKRKPLFYACESGSLESAKVLVERGAIVDCRAVVRVVIMLRSLCVALQSRSLALCFAVQNGTTPFTNACDSGNIALCEYIYGKATIDLEHCPDEVANSYRLAHVAFVAAR